jgi:phosphoglycerate dehydrogenase-like enzyme
MPGATNVVRVALLDRFAPAIEETLEAALPNSWTLIKLETAEYPDRAAAIREADVAFVMGGATPAEVTQAGALLKLIHKVGAGVDNIDLATAKAQGVAVTRLAAGNAIPVAEHALMLMLASCRRLITVDRQTRAGKWVKEDGRSKNRRMHGKRVGIIGLGAISRALAQLLTGFGVAIVYSDPVHPADLAKRLNVTPMDLDELVATSDIVTLHCPLLEDIRHILFAERIAAMKSTAILINCARGGLVDEAALNTALAESRIFAASLDVFEAEPPGASPLFAQGKLIVSAHLAGATLDNFANLARRSAENAQGYLQHGDLPADDVVVKP